MHIRVGRKSDHSQQKSQSVCRLGIYRRSLCITPRNSRLSAEDQQYPVWEHGAQTETRRAGERHLGEQKPYFVSSFAENKGPLRSVIAQLFAAQFLLCSRARKPEPKPSPSLCPEPHLQLSFSRLAASLRILSGKHWSLAGQSPFEANDDSRFIPG